MSDNGARNWMAAGRKVWPGGSCCLIGSIKEMRVDGVRETKIEITFFKVRTGIGMINVVLVYSTRMCTSMSKVISLIYKFIFVFTSNNNV